MTALRTVPRRIGVSAWGIGFALAIGGCAHSQPGDNVEASVTDRPDTSAPNPTPTASGQDPQPSPSELESAVDAEVINHARNRYLVATLPLDEWELRVDWDPADEGVMLGDVIEEDSTITVATNAGIFTPELVPGGLLVSDGEELVPVNLSDGSGNFHLMPNGVFAIYDDGTAAVMNSTDYDGDGVTFATQSGPALLLDGEVHPEFNEGSTNLVYRSGVGVSPDGQTVYLAISWSLTNFYDFATLFRDELGVEDALYLDGAISHLWVDQLPEPGALAGPYAGVITARPVQ